MLAVVLRLTWVAFETPVLQGDECEYLRLAENLLSTSGYQGLYDGPELIYPPLFPLLIALASLFTKSLRAGGFVVAILGGVALVAAIFSLARYLFGARVGLIAATLAACFPALVELSGSIYSQTIYMPLVVAGALFGLQWLEQRGSRASILCGVCFGLAYLSRPEAIAGSMLFAAAFILTSRFHATPLGTAIRGTLPMLAVTSFLAVPYVVFLSMHTGSLRFEGKSAMNYAIAQRVNSGMDLSEAQWGVGPSLKEEGPLLSPNRWIQEAPPTPPLARIPGFWFENAPRTIPQLRWILLSASFGGASMVVLAAIGWLCPLWKRERAIAQIVLSAVVTGYIVVLLGQHDVAFHYAVPLLPFLIVWSANGIETVGQTILRWSRRIAGTSVIGASWRARGVIGLLMAGLLVPTGHGFADGGAYKSIRPSLLYRREAGLWLAHQAAARRVMSAGNEVPFYAGAIALRFPHATEDIALAYVRLKSPDYLVLIREQWSVGAYYESWRKVGIPDPAAQLVLKTGSPADPDVAIYRWDTMPSKEVSSPR